MPGSAGIFAISTIGCYRIANNSRFLILPEHHYPNLASRVLALSERRLARDWRERFGYALLLLETFGDPQWFRGTSYRAANWRYVGDTRGYRRTRAGYSSTPGGAKQVFVRPLHAHAQACLARPVLDPQYHHGAPKIMLCAEQMVALPACFADIPDPRRRQGQRHPLATVLAIAAGATLCGMRGDKAISLWAQDLSQQARARFHCRYRERRYLVPSRTVIREVLTRVDPEALASAVQRWNAQHGDDEALALDGKTITADALLTQRALADYLIARGAHDFPGVGQVFAIERECIEKKTGKRSCETVYGLTSHAPESADAARVLALNRGHWTIENSCHYRLDWNWDDAPLCANVGETTPPG